MSDNVIPHTPTPEPITHQENESLLTISEEANGSQESNYKYQSPHTNIPSDLTPPPSSQVHKSTKKSGFVDSNRVEMSLPSPPTTLKIAPSVFTTGLFGEIPTIESVQEHSEEQLRGLVAELIPALSEARMSAAHSRLQYSLLSIENTESAKRAEVENEMTRREVQVLQECSQLHRGGVGNANSPRSPQSSTQRHLDLALKHCRELQNENALLERRLRQAKKLIIRLDGKNSELTEDTQRLRQRIRQNRIHLNDMRASGAMSINGTPITDFSTPIHRGIPRTPHTARSNLGAKTHVGGQDPFDALLIAGQVLNGETNSVPTSPTHNRLKKSYSSHIRGAHSLSSLPATPSRSRPITADGTLFTPINRLAAEHHTSFSAPSTQLNYSLKDRRDDRDSTISASDNDEEQAYTDLDIPASQASQRATSMLRRTSSQNFHNAKKAGAVPSSKSLKQAKIYGQVKKVGLETSESHHKRGSDVNTYDEIVRSNKKARMGDVFSDRVGLGIANWSSSVK